MYSIGLSTMGASSACIFKDNILLAAVEEERLSRVKNDDSFPILSIMECLRIAEVSINEISYISVYWQPWRIYTRSVGTLGKIFQAKQSYKPIINSLSKSLFSKVSKKKLNNGSWLDLFKIKKIIRKRIGLFNGKIFFHDHHLTHQKYAENINNWKECIILSYDGGGEDHSTVISVKKNGKTRAIKKIKWPNSLGHFYSFFTGFLGFQMLEGEYKMMGLAPLGKPKFKDQILKKILMLKSNGEYKLNTKICDYHAALENKFSKEIINIFGSPRIASSEPTQEHINLACSVQAAFEEAQSHMLNWVNKKYPNIKNLIISGGCALNVSANGSILKSGLFESISVPPAPHDAGCAIGAALITLERKNILLNNDKESDSIVTPYLGAKYLNDDVEKAFLELNMDIPPSYGEDELISKTVKALIDQKIISWFQGKSEFGPRALGGRSFLADPRNDSIRDIINAKIKKRELFRPFAPSCTVESYNQFFEIEQLSPYMNIVTNVKDDKKMVIPAVTHTDGTARVHSVSKSSNYLYHRLISEFGKLTGVPVLLNTSFNIQEPIVYSPKDAIKTFLNSDVDFLVINNFMLEKKHYL